MSVESAIPVYAAMAAVNLMVATNARTAVVTAVLGATEKNRSAFPTRNIVVDAHFRVTEVD